MRRWLMIVVARLLMSCAETTRRLSDSMDRKLGTGARLRVALHLAICRFCRRYQRQLVGLRDLLRAHPGSIDAASEPTLPEEARERIERALRESGP